MSKAKVLPFPMPGDFEDAVQKPTALVIEDNALVRTSEKLLLRYDGFNVVTAEDGKTAVEIFGEHHRDIDHRGIDQREISIRHMTVDDQRRDESAKHPENAYEL